MEDSNILFEHLSKSFLGDSVPRFSGVLQHNIRDNWLRYSNSYKNAADELVNSVTSDRTKRNIFLYPIIFLYRHSVELQMKTIIRYYKYNDDEDFNKKNDDDENLMKIYNDDEDFSKKKYNHNLETLLDKINIILKEMGIDVNDELHTNFKNRIKELDVLDKSSSSFRYPCTTKGDNSIDINIIDIDLYHFGLVMQSLSDYMNAAIDWIEDLNSGLPDTY